MRRRLYTETRKEFRVVMWSSALVMTTIIFMLLPTTTSSELINAPTRTLLNKGHISGLSLDMDCQNGGIGYAGKCICPSYVSGPRCDQPGTCNLLVDGQFTLANPFTNVSLKGDLSTCEIQPSMVCCWRDKIANETDTSTPDNTSARIKSMLEYFGPWTENDKLMLSYFFGDHHHPGSTELFQMHMDSPAATHTSIAFVIMVHSEFESRLPKLLDAIYAKHHTYMIHVDKSVKPIAWAWTEQFVHDFNVRHSSHNVHLVKNRVRGAWGSISLVYQELASIIELLRVETGDRKWSHIINLSAFDFPIKSIDKLEAFLHKNKHTNFIEVLPDTDRREIRQSALHLPCNKTLLIANFSENNDICPTGISNWMYRHRPTWTYGEGSQWHFLTRQFAEYLVSSLDSIELLFSMKYTLVPDEAFFQSALLSSPFAHTVNKYNYRYMPWADQLDVARKHVPFIKDTNAFFTRKLIDLSMVDVLLTEVL